MEISIYASVNIFCTIITRTHLKYALTLHKSLSKFHPNFKLFVLVVDLPSSDLSYQKLNSTSLSIVHVEQLFVLPIGKSVYEKYYAFAGSKLRWSLKPVMMEYLIRKFEFKKVLYVDPDIYFTGSSQYLFDLLDTNSILLNPHHPLAHFSVSNSYLLSIMSQGMYNAGFIGVNQEGLGFLDWWAKACLLLCEKNPTYGLYDDQKYLDLVPLYFDKCFIVKHPGVNLAEWNMKPRPSNFTFKEKQLQIDASDVIFFHLTTGKGGTIEYLKNSNDPILTTIISEYTSTVTDFELELKSNGLLFVYKETLSDKLRKVRNLLRPATRIRNFFRG